jgi:hypothetical protein
MNNKILEEIKEFIEKERWKYPFELNEQTRLEQDLKIYGDDADEFFLAFGKEFKVDTSKFSVAAYFRSEGDPFLSGIIRWLTNKIKIGRKNLTIKHLVKAVEAGRLDEDVINS